VALWGALGHKNTARADARRASALLEECGAQGDAQKAQSLCETPHYAFCIVGEAGTIKTGVIADLQALPPSEPELDADVKKVPPRQGLF